MASQIALIGPRGADPVEHILRLEKAAEFTVGDGLYAGQQARSFVLERTARGVDVNGAPFAPYSTKGPIYLYPNRETGAGPHRAIAAANRHKALGGNKSGGKLTPYGIRYDSYAAAKAAHGHTTVDLFGLEQHPHMLETILVRCGGEQMETAAMSLGLSVSSNESPAMEFEIGFYGVEAERARGNNEGVPSRNLPARNFWGVNEAELEHMAATANERRLQRMNAVSK